jgi:hypothetical protein
LVGQAPGLVDAVAVGAVHDEDQALRAGVVVTPKRPDLVLATDVLFRDNKKGCYFFSFLNIFKYIWGGGVTIAFYG